VQLREKVQEGSYNVQRFEEKKRLEQLLEEHTAQLMTSSTAGESTEALKMQAARLQAEVEGSRKEVVRLLEVEHELRERLHGALEETREHKRRSKMAEDGEAAARELMEEAVAARERLEAERKKLRQDLVRERERWQEELEEERSGVDRNTKELRDTIRRLQLEGAGAAQAELDELQAKMTRRCRQRRRR